MRASGSGISVSVVVFPFPPARDDTHALPLLTSQPGSHYHGRCSEGSPTAFEAFEIKVVVPYARTQVCLIRYGRSLTRSFWHRTWIISVPRILRLWCALIAHGALHTLAFLPPRPRSI